jgi:DNA polymerase I
MIYVQGTEELGNFINDVIQSKLIGFDLETSGLDSFVDIPTLAQFCLDGKQTYVFNIVKLGNRFLTYLVELINDQQNKKVIVGHNLKFDLQFLKVHAGEVLLNCYDTMQVEAIITKGISKTSFFSLEELVHKYLNQEIDKTLQTSFIGNVTGEFTDEQIEYASKDVELLFEIREKQLELIKEQKQERTLALEMDILPAYSEIELNGVRINQEKWLSLLEPAKLSIKQSRNSLIEYFLTHVKLKKYSNAFELLSALKYSKLKTQKAQNLFKALGKETFEEIMYEYMNFGSSKQTVAFLNLCGVATKSSAEKNLSGYLNHEVVQLLFKFRENAKKVSTFGSEYFKYIHPKTGKIHTTLNQNESDSGRVASSGPCLTQIPSEVDENGNPTYRGCIIPDVGWKYIDLDYSGQELRVAANILNEPKLRDAFKNNVDVHKLTASLMYKIPLEEVTKQQRHRAKTLNFGCVYGISEWGLFRNFGFGEEEAKEVLDNFWNGYSGMKKTIEDIKKQIQRNWYSTTLNGRKRFFTKPDRFVLGTKKYDKALAAILREGVNHVIQGTSADITKTAVKYIYYRNPFKENLKIVLTVHDEILCMAKEEIAQEAFDFVKECMLEAEQEFLGEVPAKVDGGIYDYWGH